MWHGIQQPESPRVTLTCHGKMVVMVMVVMVMVAFPCERGFEENVQPFIPSLCFFFFKLEIRSCTLIPLFMPESVHTGSASWNNCGQVFPDKLHVSSFPNRFPHYPCGTVSPLWLCWVKDLGVTCHLHFWQNDQGFLHATAVTRGWIRPWVRVSTQS